LNQTSYKGNQHHLEYIFYEKLIEGDILMNQDVFYVLNCKELQKCMNDIDMVRYLVVVNNINQYHCKLKNAIF